MHLRKKPNCAKKLVSAVIAGLVLAACASPPATEGRRLSYSRSNCDGSLPERVVVFQKSADAAEVYTAVSLCTQAALVTAAFDLQAKEAVSLMGG